MMEAMEYANLPGGGRMPMLGYGTWLSSKEEIQKGLHTALEVGYRHIDTAFLYQNEDAIGEVLKEWLDSGKLKREDLFITTKLWINCTEPHRVSEMLKESLRRLQLEYVDLYLIHQAIAFEFGDGLNDLVPMNEDKSSPRYRDVDHVETWKAMEQCQQEGLTRAIGVSNFNHEQMQRIIDAAEVPIANQQIETNAYLAQFKQQEFCAKNGISLCAYAPLGSPGKPGAMSGENHPVLLEDPLILALAEKYNKTPAQILVRNLYQRGLGVLPKSVTPSRIKSNFEIFDFKLSEDDMESIKKLDRDLRQFDLSWWKDANKHPQYPNNTW